MPSRQNPWQWCSLILQLLLFLLFSWSLRYPDLKKIDIQNLETLLVTKFRASVIKILFLPSMWISAILCFFSLIKTRKQDKSAQILRSITSSYFDFFDAVGNTKKKKAVLQGGDINIFSSRRDRKFSTPSLKSSKSTVWARCTALILAGRTGRNRLHILYVYFMSLCVSQTLVYNISSLLTEIHFVYIHMAQSKIRIRCIQD